MTNKLKQFIISPVLFLSPKSNPEQTEHEAYDINLCIADFPAGRQVEKYSEIPAKRTLTANMTGQVDLTGSNFNLGFNSGELKRINIESETIFDNLNCQTRFKTSKKNINYRNESAFAFDGETEYGLRTLQVPHKKRNNNRIYTDFIFNRETEQCILTITAEYPDFETDEAINEAALFELQFAIPEKGIEIKSDVAGKTIIERVNETMVRIPGKTFYIKKGNQTIKLNYLDEYNSKQFSKIDGLSIKTETYKREKYLLINPAGSYSPAPSDYYNNIKEQVCIEVKLISG